jgi:hypothetical protein
MEFLAWIKSILYDCLGQKNIPNFLNFNQDFIFFSSSKIRHLKVAPTLISAAKIQLLDITPEEAQKLITQQVNIFFIDFYERIKITQLPLELRFEVRNKVE